MIEQSWNFNVTTVDGWSLQTDIATACKLIHSLPLMIYWKTSEVLLVCHHLVLTELPYVKQNNGQKVMVGDLMVNTCVHIRCEFLCQLHWSVVPCNMFHFIWNDMCTLSKALQMSCNVMLPIINRPIVNSQQNL